MDGREVGDRGSVSVVRIKKCLLVVLGLVHVLATLFLIVPGYLSIDEIVYHWAAKNFHETLGLEIWNGYEEFPSPEMHHAFVPAHRGRLVMQYPYLFPVICRPLYHVAGYYGLFLFNAAAFVGVVILCHAVARRLFHDVELALNACLILVAGTFAWEYSQAAWPHMTSTLFIMAAFYLFVRSYLAKDSTQARYFALAAGLVGGFAPSVRMEGLLLYPVLILPFLFARPWRPTEALAVVAGTIPGLGLFSLVNYAKFGVMAPFTYGSSVPVPSEMAGLLLALLLVLWVLSRPACDSFVRRYKTALLVFVGVILVLSVAVPQTRHILSEKATSASAALVDIRDLDSDLDLSSMVRTPGRGVVYIGGHKKALLQSMPYLAILVLPMAAMIRGQKDRGALMILFLMPVVTAGYYAHAFYWSKAFAGGLSLNYRYAVPLLPFLAILSAYGVSEIRSRWGRPLGFVTMAVLCFLTATLFLFLVRGSASSVNELEFPLLGLPLLVAGVLLAVLLLGQVMGGEQIRLLAPSVWGIVTVTITWSCLVAYYYDYPLHGNQRSGNYSLGESVRQVVAGDSIFFTAPVVDPFMRLIENPRVRIAFPDRDGFKDFPKIMEFHLKSGRRVYGAFRESLWNSLKEGPLADYVVTPGLAPYPGFFVGEISVPEDSGRSRPK